MSQYVTLDSNIDGMDYRTISQKLKSKGYNIGHSTVRSIINKIMERFASVLLLQYGKSGNVEEIAQSNQFQREISFYIIDMFQKIDEMRCKNGI